MQTLGTRLHAARATAPPPLPLPPACTPMHRLVHHAVAHTYPSNAACFLPSVIGQLMASWDTQGGGGAGGGRRRGNGVPQGQDCRSSASLDLRCSSRLRLAAEEVALGLESTSIHVLGDHRLLLPGSICFPRKPTGLGCQASLRAHSSGSVLCLCCSICLRHQLLAPLSWPLYFSPRTFLLLLFSPWPFPQSLPNHIRDSVPEVFFPLCLYPAFL